MASHLTRYDHRESRRLRTTPLPATNGPKVDFWILTEGAFDRSRFSRQSEEDVLGIRLKVSSPEGTILAKLQWAVMSGGSEKQFTDALRIFAVQQRTWTWITSRSG